MSKRKDDCPLCRRWKYAESKVCGKCRLKIQRQEIPCPPEFLPKYADLVALETVIARN